MLARGLRSLDVGVACVTVQLRLLSRNKDKSIKNDRRANFQSIRLGTRRGGRQGCRFGPDIVNAAYAAALQDVFKSLVCLCVARS